MPRTTRRKGGMSKEELGLAQYLLGTMRRANDIAEKLDPKRTRESKSGLSISYLDAIVGSARALWFQLMERSPHEVSEAELNTESPAAWTQLPRGQRGKGGDAT